MNLKTLPPWSFSMIEAFENCPRQAFHKYLLKEKGPETEAMRIGNALDKAIEQRVVTGTLLPPEFAQYEPMAASVAAMKGSDTQLYTQMKLGIDRSFNVVKFFDDKVWGRGVLDVAIIKKRTADTPCVGIIADWKTGKNNENKSYSNHGLQLKIFTLLVFKFFPGLEKVTAFNLYLKSNEIGKPYQFTRADEANLWREVLPRVMKVEKACVDMNWPELPGPLCGYCPVKACKYNKS